MKKSFLLLGRTTNPLGWKKLGEFDSEDKAWQHYESRIQGRGVTAWAWCGPKAEGEQMMQKEAQSDE
jgi:hypothetical protein